MKALETLIRRLTERNTLNIQAENGFCTEVGFEWNEPATNDEIASFELINSIILPENYKQFLKISNGAVLFKDIQYGQWGCKIFGLNELISMTQEVFQWGYILKPGWLVYANWFGDCDILVFDLNKYYANEKNYIIDGEQGEQVSDWVIVPGDFSKWLDRLIVSQGSKYWRWHY